MYISVVVKLINEDIRFKSNTKPIPTAAVKPIHPS